MSYLHSVYKNIVLHNHCSLFIRYLNNIDSFQILDCFNQLVEEVGFLKSPVDAFFAHIDRFVVVDEELLLCSSGGKRTSTQAGHSRLDLSLKEWLLCRAVLTK